MLYIYICVCGYKIVPKLCKTPSLKLKMKETFLLALAVCALVPNLCDAAPPSPAAPPPPSPPAYALVVFQWLMSLCMVETCDQNIQQPPQFRLHGVWFNNATHQEVVKCPTTEDWKNAAAILRPLMGRLVAGWPSFIKPKNNWFLWGHEWWKHGTCSGKPIKDYFNASLTLFENKYKPILDALQNHRITPTRTNNMNAPNVPYVLDIYNAILTDLKLIPIIRCRWSSPPKISARYLVEIRLCAMPDLTTYQNCTLPVKDSFPGCGYTASRPNSKAIFYLN